MPRGIPLNDFQKGQIAAYRNDGYGVREIARKLLVSPNTVSNFIKHPDRNGKRKKTGSPQNVTPRDERKLARKLQKSSRSIAKARNQAGLTHVSRQTVYNYTIGSKKFVFRKRMYHPKLNTSPY